MPVSVTAKLIPVLLFLVPLLHADTVFLKNGRQMEGEVLSETASAVVLKMGPAEMTIKKSRIAEIRRSSAEALADREDALRRKYFSHDDYIDPALKEEGALYRSLKGAIQSGRKAQGDLKAQNQTFQVLEKNIEQYRAKWASASEEILRRDPGEDVDAYNRRVKAHNDIQFQLVSLTSRRDRLAETMKKNREQIRTVVKKVRTTADTFQESRDQLSPLNENQEYFFEQADNLITSADTLTRKIDLKYVARGDHAVVDVVLDDDVTVRLMVDTGASVITLPQAIADQLDLIRSPGVKAEMRMADGRKVEMEPVIIRQVAVGEAERHLVEAVIIPETEDADFSGVDGLLGMSFLRSFDLNINPASGKVELIDYAP